MSDPRGLWVQTRRDHNGVAFASGAITVTVGANTAIWSLDTEIGALPTSGYDVAVSLTAWANAAGRAWFGAATFAHSISVTGGQLRHTLTVTPGTATWAVSSNLQTLLGLPASTTAASVTGTGSWGSVAAHVDMRGWLKYTAIEGGMGGAGSWLVGGHWSGLERPAVGLILDEASAAWLTLSMTRCGNPRRAWILEERVATWRQVSLGRISEPRRHGLHYTTALTVLGGV